MATMCDWSDEFMVIVLLASQRTDFRNQHTLKSNMECGQRTFPYSKDLWSDPCWFKRSTVFWPPATNRLKATNTLPLWSWQPVECPAKWNLPRAHCFLHDHLEVFFHWTTNPPPIMTISLQLTSSTSRFTMKLFKVALLALPWSNTSRILTSSVPSLADECLCGTMKIRWFFQQLAEHLKPGLAIKSLKQEMAPANRNNILCVGNSGPGYKNIHSKFNFEEANSYSNMLFKHEVQ